MKKIISSIIVFLFLSILNVCGQTSYYVDGFGGNDLNNGTSLSTAWKTIQKACSAATPNSVVQIKAGTYNENIIINISSTAGNFITIKNYMNDIVLIDGTGTSGTTMLQVANKNYLSFENLTIQNLTVSDAQGVLVETTGSGTSTDLLFKNIVIKNINWTSSSTTIPTSNDNAQGFIAYGRDGGITNITIDSCRVFNNILGFSEAMTLDGNVDGFTIKNCEIHDNTNIGIDIAGNYTTSSNPATDQARNGLVSQNKCYNNVSNYATSAGIYIDGGQDVTIEKNKCYENGWGIEVGCEENGTVSNVIVKNNLIFNNKQGGLAVGGYTTATTGQVLNSTFRNNTFFQNNSMNDGTGELSLTKLSSCIFENNIFYTNSQNVLMSIDNISPQTGNAFNYNSWFTPSNNANNITVNWRTSTYTTFAAYKTATSQEGNSIYNNPGLVNPVLPTPDLHLLFSSVCIDAGMPAMALGGGETDYDGNARIIGLFIDIGAFEFDATQGVKPWERNSNQSFFYPNPFSFETIISFDINLINADLKVYNTFGEEIKEVKNISGREIKINRDQLTEGIYFYKIIQDNKLFSAGKLVVK